jgi:hypothetical protein
MNGMGRHALMPVGSAGDPAFAAGVKHFILSKRNSVSKSRGYQLKGDPAAGNLINCRSSAIRSPPET